MTGTLSAINWARLNNPRKFLSNASSCGEPNIRFFSPKIIENLWKKRGKNYVEAMLFLVQIWTSFHYSIQKCKG